MLVFVGAYVRKETNIARKLLILNVVWRESVLPLRNYKRAKLGKQLPDVFSITLINLNPLQRNPITPSKIQG